MDQKQGIPLLCMLESVQYYAGILENPSYYLLLNIQLQFFLLHKKKI